MKRSRLLFATILAGVLALTFATAQQATPATPKPQAPAALTAGTTTTNAGPVVLPAPTPKPIPVLDELLALKFDNALMRARLLTAQYNQAIADVNKDIVGLVAAVDAKYPGFQYDAKTKALVAKSTLIAPAK